jgi:hypothetical protein
VSRRALAWCLLLAGCYANDAGSTKAPRLELGDPIMFAFGSVQGGELSSDTTRGRTTLLLFVTTYDLPSQAEAQLLRDVVSSHKPRANAGIVVLEPPNSAALAQVWADSLGLTLPVAMAGPALLAGESPLGRIAGVPTLVVLDRRGRLVARSEGAQSREQILALGAPFDFTGARAAPNLLSNFSHFARDLTLDYL